MKNIILIQTLILCIYSCTIEKYGSTETILKNDTDYSIQILSYKGDKVYEEKNIPPKHSLVALKMNVKGKTIYPNYGTLLQPFDSVVVIYNNTVSVTHLRFDSKNDKGIPFSSTRNLTNPDSYIKVITNETKYSITGYYSYTFSEQDFLDASQ